MSPGSLLRRLLTPVLPTDARSEQAPKPSAEPATTTPAAPAAAVNTDQPPVDAHAPAAGGPAGVDSVEDQPAQEASSAIQPATSAPLRTIAIANQKGGVGKTTTAVNLGACLAELGYRTLIVDLDPQGNASTGLSIDPRAAENTMYDVLLADLPIDECIRPTDLDRLSVAPASLDLAGAEIELVSTFSRETRLRRAFEGLEAEFDFILIDSPPSLGLLTVNGLAAASEVLVPIQCEYYALEGLGQLLQNVELVRQNLNPSLEVSAIVLVMYDGRTKLADDVVAEVRAHFPDQACETVVPRSVRLSEAPSFGQPIITYDPGSRGATAYRALAKEVSSGTP